jgi:aminoglycoside 3-N-acetyltransferase
LVAPPELSKTAVIDQLRALGVKSGGVLLVHTAFRTVRPIEGGPLGLIAALRDALGPDGTLVMPSMSDNDDAPFDPATSRAAADLGVVAQMFWQLPDVMRSDHPFAFAAIGPQAAAITADPLPLPPHGAASPVGRVHDFDGQVLLLGCSHGENTTLHLAEILAGVPYRVPRHRTVLKDGRPVRIDYGENDHCCERFALADDWLRSRGLQREGNVGHAHARLSRAKDIVQLTVENLKRDPLTFLHPAGASCGQCDDAHASLTRPSPP